MTRTQEQQQDARTARDRGHREVRVIVRSVMQDRIHVYRRMRDECAEIKRMKKTTDEIQYWERMRVEWDHIVCVMQSVQREIMDASDPSDWPEPEVHDRVR